jgi:nicotinamidase/pyrazinamidase
MIGPGADRRTRRQEDPMSRTYTPTTALVVADVQNDFADPEGNLYVSGGDQIVPLINAEIAAARDAGAPVLYTQDWHPPSTPHFQKDGGVWPVHCVHDSWGAEFHPELDVIDDAPVVRKGVGGEDGYSAFSLRDPLSGEEAATELGHLLADAGVDRLVVTGLAGDWCVKATALDGRELGYEVEVPLEMTRMVELEPGDGERAIQQMREAGVDVTSA